MPRAQRVGVAAAVATASLLFVLAPLATTASAAPAAPASKAETTMCPSDTANGRFVRWIYLQILERCPDSGGRAYWTNKLQSGFRSANLAAALYASNEFYEGSGGTPSAYVDVIYVSILQRLGIEVDEFSTGKGTMRGLEMV